MKTALRRLASLGLSAAFIVALVALVPVVPEAMRELGVYLGAAMVLHLVVASFAAMLVVTRSKGFRRGARIVKVRS